jgi:hypothetical protein
LIVFCTEVKVKLPVKGNIMSIKKLIQFLNRPDLTTELIDVGFETTGHDIGVVLASRILKARPREGYKTQTDILSINGIGPQRFKLMLDAASQGRLDTNNGDPQDDTGYDPVVSAIIENPSLIPSFRSQVPLGISDQMLALVDKGAEALPALQSLLAKEHSAAVNKAAVVMLAHIDSPVAESLIVGALDDPDTVAEALVVLANYNMRDPNGSRAYETNFLYDPETALNKILPHINNHKTVILTSGFTVFNGPISHIALGAAARIYGVKHFISLLTNESLMTIGLEAVLLPNFIFEVLFDFFRRLLDAIRSDLGITDDGVIMPTVKNDRFTLSFTCNKECDCNKIAWIQICKATLPGGDIGYAAGERRRDTDADGSLVDRLNGRTNPVYGSGNDAEGTIPASSGQYGKSGKPPTPAKLTDKPSGPIGTIFLFESCVFCIEGKDAGTCYGCYKWKCTIGPGGKPSYENQGSADKPSEQFKKAAKEWNAVAGKKDTPDPDKW